VTELKIGHHLRTLREERGLSIEQLSAETRISSKVLRALESDDPKLFPAQAITRGFIINALKVLGEDPELFLQQHSLEMAALGGVREGSRSHFEGYAFEQQELDQNRRWMTVSAVVGAVFILAALFILKPKLKKRHHAPEELHASEKSKVVQPDLEQAFTQEASPTPVASPEAPAAPPVAIVEPSPTPLATVSPTPRPDPLSKGDDLEPKAVGIKIAFKALQDTYVQYQSDDRRPFTLVFRAGKLLVIKAERQIRFRVQNNEAVELKIRSGAFAPLTLPDFKIDKTGAIEPQSGGISGLKDFGTAPPVPKP
jgi:cytoskeletal protein RodZ